VSSVRQLSLGTSANYLWETSTSSLFAGYRTRHLSMGVTPLVIPNAIPQTYMAAAHFTRRSNFR
jgi:hypothetical protein